MVNESGYKSIVFTVFRHLERAPRGLAFAEACLAAVSHKQTGAIDFSCKPLLSCLTKPRACSVFHSIYLVLSKAYRLDCRCRRLEVEMHKQALRARQGPACSTSGRDGSFKMSLSSSVSSCGRTRQHVTARANAASSNANSMAVLAQAPAPSSSRALSSKASRKNTCMVRSVLADAPSQAVEGFSRGGHWQVHKFGGTCMASSQRLKAAAELVSPS